MFKKLTSNFGTQAKVILPEKKKEKKLLPLKKKRPKSSKGTKNKSIKCSNKLNNNSSECIPSRNYVSVKENSHKSICLN